MAIKEHIVINNDGGGIFHRLPIKDYDPIFTDLFITPHGLTFEHAAKMYGLDYAAPSSRAECLQALQHSIEIRTPTLIEITTDSKEDLRRRKMVMEVVKAKLEKPESVTWFGSA